MDAYIRQIKNVEIKRGLNFFTLVSETARAVKGNEVDCIKSILEYLEIETKTPVVDYGLYDEVETDKGIIQLYEFIQLLQGRFTVSDKPQNLQMTEQNTNNETQEQANPLAVLDQKALENFQEKAKIEKPTDEEKEALKAQGYKVSEITANTVIQAVNNNIESLTVLLNGILESEEPLILLKDFLAVFAKNKPAMRIMQSALSGGVVNATDVSIAELSTLLSSEIFQKAPTGDKFNIEAIEEIQPTIEIDEEAEALATLAERSTTKYSTQAKKASAETVQQIAGTFIALWEIFAIQLAKSTEELEKKDPKKFVTSIKDFITLLIAFNQGSSEPFRAKDAELALFGNVTTKTIKNYRKRLIEFLNAHDRGLVSIKQSEATKGDKAGTTYTLTIMEVLSERARDFIANGQSVSMLTIQSALQSKDTAKEIELLPEAEQKAIKQVTEQVKPAFEELPEASVELRASAKALQEANAKTAERKAKADALKKERDAEKAQALHDQLKPFNKAIKKAEEKGEIDATALKGKHKLQNNTLDLTDEEAQGLYANLYARMQADAVALTATGEHPANKERLASDVEQMIKRLQLLIK